MPGSLSGCDNFDKPAVWPLDCHSELSGEYSAEDHKQLQETSRLLGFACFKEVFDAYLTLDITAYADLMQIFGLHFFDR